MWPARNLRIGTPFVVGLIYDNPNPYHIIGVQNGVLAACRETGFGLQIHPCDSTSPLLAEELSELVQRSRLAGLVLTAPMSESMELVQALAARGVKLVRIIAATHTTLDPSAAPNPPRPGPPASVRSGPACDAPACR